MTAPEPEARPAAPATPAAPAGPAAARRPARKSWLATFWPLLAVAVVLVVAAGYFLPGLELGFSSTKASQAANDKALAALQELKPESTPAEVIAALNLININFTDKEARIPRIPTQAEPVLLAAAKTIAALPPEVKIEIRGYTDDTLGRELGMTLSLYRAQSVVDYLHGNGVPQGKVAAIGGGDFVPIADNKTTEGRFRNRRLVFAISK